MDELLYDAELALAAELADHPMPEDIGQTERLAAAIEQAVWRETSGKVKNLRVDIGRRGVVLSGRCTTYYAKQQAQHAAMRLLVGEPLVNQIEVV